ncbi:Rid family hydrolase [Puniceicoccus vermicola]|uniref:Uncharacterized protein n=1 Tax=Puniceicoccus vermicola TaxID=388746 RepID=A0A7X1B3M6_9BACT|nr:Rid family hydrolase [Puniceicoccus vermicola]MBC2603928.1 hypothetical protein [Puniceicoccus vermicola]
MTNTDNMLASKIPLAGKDSFFSFLSYTGSNFESVSSLQDYIPAQDATVIGPEIYASPNQTKELLLGNGCTEFYGTKNDIEFHQGIQLGIVEGIPATPILLNAENVGIVYEDEEARYALIGNLFPSDISASRGNQTEQILNAIEQALQTIGMSFQDVIRTWFYNDRILEWYDEFNRARDDFFEKHNVFANLVPASTGVGSRNRRNAALMARAFAVQPKTNRVHAKAIASPLQCPALDYRSTFSRAVELNHPNFRQLIISGTASIEPGGKTVHLNDVQHQIALSMEVVQAILHSREMDWSDAVRAVVYLKDFASAPEFERYLREHGIENLPYIMIQSDVCRDDLLFEIELDAAIVH